MRRVEVDEFFNYAAWGARVHREARRGARVVAGISGEVLRVDAVGLDGFLGANFPGHALS